VLLLLLLLLAGRLDPARLIVAVVVAQEQ